MAQPLRILADTVGTSAGYPVQGAADARQGSVDREAQGTVPAPGNGVEAPEPAGDAADAPAPLVSLAFHESSGRWMAVYTDAQTGRVLKTLPPEELLDAVGRVRQGLGRYLDTYR